MMNQVGPELTEWENIYLRNTASILPHDQRSPFHTWAGLVKLVNEEIQSLINKAAEASHVGRNADETEPPALRPYDESPAESNSDDLTPPILSPAVESNSDHTSDTESMATLGISQDESASETNTERLEPPNLEPATESTSCTSNQQTKSSALPWKVTKAAKTISKALKQPSNTKSHTSLSTATTSNVRPTTGRTGAVPKLVSSSRIPAGRTLVPIVETPRRRPIRATTKNRPETISNASKQPPTKRIKSSTSTTTVTSTTARQRPVVKTTRPTATKTSSISSTSTSTNVGGVSMARVASVDKPKVTFSGLRVPLRQKATGTTKPSASGVVELPKCSSRPAVKSRAKTTISTLPTLRNKPEEEAASSSTGVVTSQSGKVRIVALRSDSVARPAVASRTTTYLATRGQRTVSGAAKSSSTATVKIPVPVPRVTKGPKTIDLAKSQKKQ